MNLTIRQKEVLSILALLGLTLIWGSTFIMVKWAVESLDVYYFLFLRFFVAFVFLFVLFFKKLIRIDRETLRSAFILSIFLFISFAAQTEGLRFTTASNSALITGLYLVLVPFFSAVFFKTEQNILSIIGAVTSLIGLFLLTNYSPTGFNLGDGITLICSIGFSWQIILTGKYSVRHNAIVLVAAQLFFVSLFAGSVAAYKHAFTLDFTAIALVTIAVTAILATVVAFVVQTIAQRFIDPTRAGIIFGLEAAFGVIFACAFGGETLTMISLIGAFLMFTGMITSEIRPVAKYLLDKIVG